jgi:preprotein translocase SecE subunit
MELLKELFRVRRYKVSQGHLIRRLTMVGVWVLFATAAWKCTQMDYTWVGSRVMWFGTPAEVARMEGTERTRLESEIIALKQAVILESKTAVEEAIRLEAEKSGLKAAEIQGQIEAEMTRLTKAKIAEFAKTAEPAESGKILALAEWLDVRDGWKQTADTVVFSFPYCMAGLIFLFGLWFGYRLVHWLTFADFLISVEAEMAKVSWPGNAELRSSTIVVLVVFLLLAGMIYIYDLILVFLFGLIKVM